MKRDFAAYLFTLFCPLFTSGASFSITHEYSVRNLNLLCRSDDGGVNNMLLQCGLVRVCADRATCTLNWATIRRC